MPRPCHGHIRASRVSTRGTLMQTNRKQMDHSYDEINTMDEDAIDNEGVNMSSNEEPLLVTTSGNSASYVDERALEADVTQADEGRVADVAQADEGLTADYQVSPALAVMMARGVDMHGFRVALRGAEYVNVILKSMGGVQERTCLWKELERKHGYGWYKESRRSKFSSLLRCFPPETQLPFLARKGIPPAWRRMVWLEASLARSKKKQHPYLYYNDLLQKGRGSSDETMARHIKLIRQDVRRTFCDHTLIGTVAGRKILRDVLLAYAVHNPSVGYCQGMSDVAGMLLVAMKGNAKDTFWMLATLLEDIVYPGFYGDRIRGALIEMHASFELLKECNPRLAGHIEWVATKDGVTLDNGYLTGQLWLTVFARIGASETVMRLWDILFTSRHPAILFGASIAVFKIAEPQLLQIHDYHELGVLVKETFQTRLFFPDIVLGYVDQALKSFPDFDSSLARARKHALAHMP